jgi:hypothetical protein
MRLLFAIALIVLALLLAAFLLFVRPAWSAPSCLTSEEKTLGRLQTLCSDGSRAVSTWKKTLERWESIITLPPGKRCTGQMHPKTRQLEGRCR